MAKRLELELVKPTSVLALWTWIGIAVLLVSSVFAVLVWRAYLALQTQQQVAQTQLQKLQLARRLPVIENQPQHDVEVNAEQLHSLRLTAIELATPWNQLFNALEKSSMNDIAILGLQPDSKKQQVIISGEAKYYISVLAYLDKLAKQSMLADVYLQKHAINEADKDKPVRFTIFARWLIASNETAI